MAFRSRRCLLAQLLSRGSLQRSFASESTVHRQIPRVDWKVEQAEQIQQQLLQKDEPAVLAGALQRWPLSRWKLEHLRKLGDVIVPMELSWYSCSVLTAPAGGAIQSRCQRLCTLRVSLEVY